MNHGTGTGTAHVLGQTDASTLDLAIARLAPDLEPFVALAHVRIVPLKLLAERSASPALQLGDYRSRNDVPEDCYVYERISGDERITIALNFGSEPRSVPIGDGAIALSTRLDLLGPIADGRLELRAHEGVIVRH